MKKVLATLLSVLMVLSMLCTGALANEEILGDWYTLFMGEVMHVVLNGDGTVVAEIEGVSSNEGTWSYNAEDNSVVLFEGTDDEMPLYYDASIPCIGNFLFGIEFRREEPVKFEPAEVVADAALEDLAGTWDCTLVDFLGTVGTPDQVEMDLGMAINGSTMTITAYDLFGFEEVFDLEGEFAEGALVGTIPAEEEWDDDEVYECRLHVDGTLSVTTYMLGMPVIYYMAIAE